MIPSLGGSVLFKTIRYLNQGIIKPDQIFVCVPKGIFPKLLYFKKRKNISIIQCPYKGQVKQKIYGFSYVKSKYTLQLDDDILVDKNCLKTFLRAAKTKSSKNAYGAFLRGKNNSIYEFISSNLLKQLINILIFGERYLKMRKVLKVGVPTNLFDQKNFFLSKSEWLNGILFTNTKNLVKLDYYNFKGKAYNEDVIYSGILRKNSIDLWVNNKAICFEQTQNVLKNNEKYNINYWFKTYKTRKLIISLYKGSFLRMIFFMFLEIMKLIYFKLMRR